MKKAAPSAPVGSLATSPSTLVVGGTDLLTSFVRFFNQSYPSNPSAGTDDDLSVTIKLDEKKLKAVRPQDEKRDFIRFLFDLLFPFLLCVQHAGAPGVGHPVGRGWSLCRQRARAVPPQQSAQAASSRYDTFSLFPTSCLSLSFFLLFSAFVLRSCVTEARREREKRARD